MALSDCEMCWSTPCMCGYYFKKWDKPPLMAFIVSTTKYFGKEDAIQMLEGAVKMCKSLPDEYFLKDE